MALGVTMEIPLVIKDRFNIWKSGCVVWTGYIGPGGYGIIGYKNKYWRVHRLIWTLLIGEIPMKMNILHRCDNPACINIKHLFIGTQLDNMQDMKTKGRGNWVGQPGILNGNSKLNSKIVREMKNLRLKNKLSFRKIANKYDISTMTAFRAITGKSWADQRGKNE